MTAQHQLMKRGEREVARILRNECCRSGGDAQLNDFLSYLLDPNKPLDDTDRLRWCRALIAGDASFEEYSRTISTYDDASVCGLVWTADFVAYRCRTCGISPCMSLCSECFHAADHAGHDFNMFRSQAGGACDCGDVTVMRPIGFCTKHGPNRRNRPSIPAELVTMPKLMMGRLLIRLVQHLREYSPVEMHGAYTVSMPEGEAFIEFLQQLSDMGAVMKSIITKAITDTQLYAGFIRGSDEQSSYHLQSGTHYRTAVESMSSFPVPTEFQDVVMLTQPLTHNSMLDELFFWAVKYEFPQKLATFLLSLLPNDEFKELFTLTFVRHYTCITKSLMNVLDKSRLANRVVHISVQLLSPPLLAYKMVTEYQLLHVVLASLRLMVDCVLCVDTNTDSGSCNHKVVDCSHSMLVEHSYWPIVSDLINLLAHREVALYFMADKKLVTFWAKIISCFQGMNANMRELKQHVVYEPESYYAAFSAELEICASIMWSLVAHLNDKTTAGYTKNVLEVFVKALKDWFAATRTSRFTVPYSLQMSFHYPLHRYFAVLVNNAVNVQQVDLDEVLPSISFLHMLMIHPLHLMVSSNEIYAGMWVRNGHQILGQAMTYLQSHFCNSTIDADIFLIQLISSQLDPDYIVHTVLDRFRVLSLLTFSKYGNSRSHYPYRDREHDLPMLESALAFLSVLIGERINLGMTQSNVIAREMTALLAVSDRTHSNLIDSMPEKCGLTSFSKDYEPTLAQVADFKTPIFEPGGAMQQGKYILKGSVWLNDYNPLHILVRALNRRDVQTSLTKFTEFVKQQGLYKDTGNPWPPFRIPMQPCEPYVSLNKLLHCRSMHAMLFTLLYKALKHNSYPEAIVYYTIHLLELAISIPNPDAGRKKVLIEDKQVDRQFSHWFAVDCIFTNVSVVIDNVTIEECQTPSTDLLVSSSRVHVNVDDDDDDDDEEMDDLQAVMATDFGTDTLVVVPAAEPLSPTSATSLSPSSGTVSAISGSKVLATAEDFSSVDSGHRSCGVTADMSAYAMVDVPVNESVLSLLFKLHKQFSSRPQEPYRFLPAEARASVESRVGNAEFFIKKVLDKICLESGKCSEMVNSLCQGESAAGATHGETVSKQTTVKDVVEERRRKAKQRQEKLMREFANKQKQFMENVVTSADMDVEPGTSSAAVSTSSEGLIESASLSQRTYDCCICSLTAQSRSDRLIGLVGLLQPTSFLGHRQRHAEPSVLPVSEAMLTRHNTSFARAFTRRFRSLTSEFEETSCVLSVNLGWEGGVYVQTCGHYLHLDCQKSYITALKSQMPLSQGLKVADGEFWCPLCRQLSNTVLPILPDEICCETLCSGQQIDLVPEVAELLNEPASVACSENVKQALETVISDLTGSTLPVHRMLVPCDEMSPFVFVCSILRTNLEIEIDMYGGSPCLQPSSNFVTKKSCIPLLFQILNTDSKMLLQRSQAELWSHITGFKKDNESRSLLVYHEEVPLLLRDATCLFIQLVLRLPLPITKAVYQCIVHSLYNVQLVQFAVSLTHQLTVDERLSWQSLGQQSTCRDLELLVCRVLETFERMSLSTPDDCASDAGGLPAICHESWSPVSADSARIQHVLPFLRVAALLQFHIFGEKLPSVSEHNNGEELSVLAVYLGLIKSGDIPSAAAEPSDINRLHGIASNVLGDPPIDTWCQHLARRRTDPGSRPRVLLTINPSWYPAQLYALPKLYEQIFDFYRKRLCQRCGKIPKNPALCLVCGELVCYKDTCCVQGTRLECVQHSVTCGSGTGIFLVVNSSVIIIIRGLRAAIWGSVYLDAHGEEDRELKRGKPLQLSVERYRVLQNLWTSHSFDNACKHWVFHNNKL